MRKALCGALPDAVPFAVVVAFFGVVVGVLNVGPFLLNSALGERALPALLVVLVAVYTVFCMLRVVLVDAGLWRSEH